MRHEFDSRLGPGSKAFISISLSAARDMTWYGTWSWRVQVVDKCESELGFLSHHSDNTITDSGCGYHPLRTPTLTLNICVNIYCTHVS